MKEIDFLPAWYKKNRRRKRGYKWQYGVISACFVFMVCWSFISGKIVNSTSAVDTPELNNASQTMLEFEKYKNNLSRLSKNKQLLDKCRSRINVANILAELSHIIDNSVILSKIEISSKEYKTGQKTKSGSVIKKSAKSDEKTYDNNVIYKIILKGISGDNNSAAQLICDLEESSYFSKVILGYSKNTSFSKKQVTEFEISCYLANFKEVKEMSD